MSKIVRTQSMHTLFPVVTHNKFVYNAVLPHVWILPHFQMTAPLWSIFQNSRQLLFYIKVTDALWNKLEPLLLDKKLIIPVTDYYNYLNSKTIY